jgi:hypothetical protein
LFSRKSAPYRAAFHWGTSTLATASQQGEITVYRMSHYDHPLDDMKAILTNCRSTDNDSLPAQLAALLENDDSAFPDDPLGISKYYRLAQYVKQHPVAPETDAEQKAIEAWLKRNEASRLGRICLASQEIRRGWNARGDGAASTVSPENFQIFDQHLERAANILETFRDEETIPNYAYELIFDVAKAQNWLDKKTEYYVERLFREHPKYIPAHTARMEGLLPRWGGGPDDCRQYADRVARHIGGQEGDAAYAQMVVGLTHYGNHGIVDELGFDPQRFQAGLDFHYRNNRHSPHYLQLGLLLASIAGDEGRMKQFAMKIDEQRSPYVGSYCSERMYQNLLRVARTLP